MTGSTALDLADVQGVVVRGYRMPHARHLLLRVEDAPAARTFLGSLVDRDGDALQVTTAEPWTQPPECCVNVSITYGGLQALGVPGRSLDTFPDEFTAGAVARADRVGDVGPSSPEQWMPVFRDPGLHVLVHLFGRSGSAVDHAAEDLLARAEGGLSELCRLEAAALDEDRRVEHFGYVDGISQPSIESAPPTDPPDRLSISPTGMFLLGHPTLWSGGPGRPPYTYPVPTPEALGRNGSFAAFRVLAQDVGEYLELLAREAERTGLSEELIAAKLCGRWRNGTPLVLSTDTATPLPYDRLNDFDYSQDPRGLACPIGSHIRRMNPRGAKVAGGGPDKRRIVRRALTYGPRHDPNRPDDVERGILGLFIGVSLCDQFEFLMGQWANDGLFAAGLGRTKDPITGAQEETGGTFALPLPGRREELTGLPRLVTTRGGAYTFIPSISAIRHVAGA
jgi:deferrochelatase/peroxidase EfeB